MTNGAALSLVFSVTDRNAVDNTDNESDSALEEVNNCYTEALDAEKSNPDCEFFDYESGYGEDTIDLTAEPTNRRTYRLREFCVTRWFSAWLVMHRFYCLFDALRHLATEMTSDATLYRGEKRDKFIKVMEDLNPDVISRALHYLYPIVQGINYCQKDSTLQMDISPMMDHLQQFYRLHSLYDGANPLDVIFPLPRETVLKIFASRTKLFHSIPESLRGFFYDDYIKKHGVVDKHDPCFQEYVQNICFSISVLAFSSEALPKDLVAEIKQCPGRIMQEVTGFLTNQYRLNLHSFMEYTSTIYPLLYKIYLFFFSQPASSASVERSFSVQNSFLTPSRNRLMPGHVKMMLFIKMNYKMAKKNGWERELLDYMNAEDSGSQGQK